MDIMNIDCGIDCGCCARRADTSELTVAAETVMVDGDLYVSEFKNSMNNILASAQARLDALELEVC